MRLSDRVHTDALPQSYYADTCKDKNDFPTLESSLKTDVCIVGGGFTGVAAALHLKERGYDVVLLEQNKIGWGASGRNGGQIIGGYGPALSDFTKIKKVYGEDNAMAAWKMGVECVDIISGWIEKYQIDCDLTWGYFDAAMKQRDMDGLLKSRESLISLGYKPEQKVIGKDDLRTIVGTDFYIGGVTNMGWGHVHVLDLIRGEARAAEKLGAKILEDVCVEDIDYSDPAVIKTNKGNVVTDYVILAGNAYLGKLVPKLETRVTPAGSYIITTEPLSEELAAEIMPADYAVCDQRWALDYFRMTKDRRLMFGGMATYSGLHPKNIKKALVPSMEKVFPQLKDVKIDHEWGGYMGIGLNRVPQVGRLAPNVYYAQAYSGHGVAPTHMSAKLITEAITGQAGRFDILGNIKHSPFPGGRMLRAPIQAIGMAYYRLLDALG